MGLLNSWPFPGRRDDEGLDPTLWNGMLGFRGRPPAAVSGGGQPVAPGSEPDDAIQPVLLAQASTQPGDAGANPLLQFVSDRRPPPRPAVANTRPAAAGGAQPYTRMSAEELGNTVFNETKGLSGNDIPFARLQLVQSIMNAEDRWGAKRDERARTAKPTLPANMGAREQQILQDVYGTVQQAMVMRSLGLDTTNGATNFNMRTTDDMSAPRNRSSYKIERRWGPFQSNGTPYRYVDIYQNPEGRR